jgi:glycerol-3-phosphate acyltransferase PlsY
VEIAALVVLFLVGGIASAHEAMKWLERRQLDRRRRGDTGTGKPP